jgi:hypothetical protein
MLHMTVTLDIAKKVLDIVDQGLVRGLGKKQPGKMCVEAAVCYAYDLPHSDKPPCVEPGVRNFKIVLNDASWSSNAARAAGMRRLAVAQLGSAGVVDFFAFQKGIQKIAVGKILPQVLRDLSDHMDEKDREGVKALAALCERDVTMQATEVAHDALCGLKSTVARPVYAVYAYAYVAAAAATHVATQPIHATHAVYVAVRSTNNPIILSLQDSWLNLLAEEVVQLLIQLESPGTQYLYLTE